MPRARVGGLRVPFTDSFPRLDLVSVLVWWRLGGALNRVLRQIAICFRCVPAVCLGVRLQASGNQCFFHCTILFYFKNSGVGVLSKVPSRCPTGGHQFPV